MRGAAHATPIRPGVLPLVRRLTRGFGREALLVGVLIGLAYLVVRMSDRVAIGAFNDDAVYVALGKALASGEGYRSIYAVGEPVHMKYPPLLPLLFAGLWKVGGTLWSVVRLATNLSLIVSSLAGGLLWYVARSTLGLSRGVALGFVVAPFFLEACIQYFNLPVTEPYFVLAWAATLALYGWIRSRSGEAMRIRWSVGLGLLAAATVLLRVQGVALAGAVLIALAMDRSGWRAVGAYAVSALTPAAAWFWWHGHLAARGPISSQPDELPYFSWVPTESVWSVVEFVGSAMASNWIGYWRLLPSHLSPSWVVGFGLCVLFLLLALLGGLFTLRRHPVVVLTLVAVVASVLAWPYTQDRFVVTFLPFVGLLIGVAVQRIVRGRTHSVRLLVYLLFVSIVPLIALRQVQLRSYGYRWLTSPRTVEGIYPSIFLLGNTAFLLTASNWVRAHTSAEERVLVDNAAGLYLHTGRKTVSSAPAESDLGPSVFDVPGRFLAGRILDDSVTLVILANPISPLASEIAALARQCPSVLEFLGLVEGWAKAALYRVARQERCIRERVLRVSAPAPGALRGSVEPRDGESRSGRL